MISWVQSDGEKEWMPYHRLGNPPPASWRRPRPVEALFLVLGLVAYSCFGIIIWHSIAESLGRSPAAQGAHHLSSIVVGPRQFAPQYHGRGCSSAELLHALKLTHIRPDGASRKVNMTAPNTKLDLKDGHFDFSFDLEGCPRPHLFSAEEACDLLRGYGGVFFRGDSFVRHIVNALFMLLRERTDGAVDTEGERCRGNAMFDDR